MSRRGSAALPAAITVLVVAGALAAALAELAASEVWLAGRRRAAARALDAADSCVARILATTAPGWDFGPMLAGPDALAGTIDDGRVVTPPGCVALVTPAPGGADPPRVLVSLEARAGGGSRGLDALLGRDPNPGAPAVVWLAGAPTADALAGTLVLDGVEAGTPPWAALAAPVDPEALDAWAAGAGAGLAVAAGTDPPITAPAPPLAELAFRVRAGGPGGTERLAPGGPPPPGLALVEGDLVVNAPLYGAGLLHVTGTLDIRAGLDFTGLVVAEGGMRVAPGASLALRGALWLGTLDPAALAGSVRILRDGVALAVADGLVPLPRRARLLGLRDHA